MDIHSPFLRPAVFFGLFAILCFFEVIAPKRKLTQSKKKRWISNLSLSFFNIICLRFLVPFTLVVVTLKAQDLNIGLFNILDWPYAIEFISSLIIFDFFIYLQHIATHKFAFLWMFHTVHHIDLDLDLSSGSRFHTIEILLSFLFKGLLVFLIGPPIAAIILFEVILNALAMFNHSNIRIPEQVDKVLRLFIVTPDMHRVHHSVEKKEYNKNFGFNLSLWDYLFKTYKKEPDLGHQNMIIGLKQFREENYISFFSLIKMPFIKYKSKN